LPDGIADDVGATKGCTVEEKNGETVLSVIDALVRQSLGGTNDALLRKWESVRLIRRTTANSSSVAATSQATPAPGTTAAGVTASVSAPPTSLPANASTPAATAA
jgi:hypothetical protein